jgi:hypothetical protein
LGPAVIEFRSLSTGIPKPVVRVFLLSVMSIPP